MRTSESLGDRLHLIALALAYEAEAALAVLELAVARAQIALHATVGQKVEPPSGVMRLEIVRSLLKNSFMDEDNPCKIIPSRSIFW